MIDYGFHPVDKPGASVRVKLTQKQKGDISNKVRKKVRERSEGYCEVMIKCKGARAVQQAHITGRGHIDHKTTELDLLDSCLACHKYLDEHPEGIRTKRLLARQTAIALKN
ncbi:hypothetical protein [Paenibacillus kribbensis]|uniref:hypothetical protein n=1 Tax=Paenibacillus kribbensis TaxID=172713 RepID=UPI000837D405|nr:hypothetical protein [Paenibacillus kribbensis]